MQWLGLLFWLAVFVGWWVIIWKVCEHISQTIERGRRQVRYTRHKNCVVRDRGDFYR